MRLFMTIAGATGLLAILYFLYELQLGAISFFILSIFFFSLAFLQISKKDIKDGKKGYLKSALVKKRRNNRLS
ncbi:hypothetical protein [Mesobacillus foraminis]|nr:hypothetical protein [Mesobacillus foraminis]